MFFDLPTVNNYSCYLNDIDSMVILKKYFYIIAFVILIYLINYVKGISWYSFIEMCCYIGMY